MNDVYRAIAACGKMSLNGASIGSLRKHDVDGSENVI